MSDELKARPSSTPNFTDTLRWCQMCGRLLHADKEVGVHSHTACVFCGAPMPNVSNPNTCDEKVISKKAADLIGDYGDARQEVSGDFGICPDDELYHEEALKALKNYVGDLEAMVERLIGVGTVIIEYRGEDWGGLTYVDKGIDTFKAIAAEWKASQNKPE